METIKEFDPETCSLDDLRKRINELEDEEEYYNTMQLSAKQFINSVYGVFGTEFFNLANTDIAESITLQGQDLIKYSVVQINDYIKNLWNQDYEGHKRIADRMKNIFGDAFAYDKFINAARTNKVLINTLQCYGDSITGDCLIDLHNGEKIAIKDLFDECCESKSAEKIRVSSDRIIKSYDIDNGCVAFYKIKYIMRHYTRKRIFKIVSSSGKSVLVTSDHSVIILRDGNVCESKPQNILYTDKIILSDNLNTYIDDIEDVSCVFKEYNDFVYDIEVDTETENHNFFANGILVHNTDSVSKDSIIKTKSHVDGIKIEDFFEENNKKQNKRWLIKTDDGEIIVEDKVCVLRDGEKIYVDPSDVCIGDNIVTDE